MPNINTNRRIIYRSPSASSPGGFDPTLYGTVWSWHRLNTGITEIGGAVSQWNDQSGNARHFTQGTAANRPVKTVIGGLKFDGSNDTMSAGSQASPTEYTQFFLYKPNQLGQSILLDGSGASETLSLSISNNYTKNADPQVVFGNGTTYTLGGTSWDILEYGSYQLVTVKVTSAGNTFDIWVNGVKETVSYTSQAANCGGFSGNFIIGNSADCEILESLIYSTALSDADIDTVNSYLLGLVSYTQVGDMVNTGFTAAGDLTGWTRSVPASFTTSANGLVINSTGADTCIYTAQTLGVEDWDMEGSFDVGDVSVTNFSFCLGVSPVLAGYARHRIQLYLNSGFPVYNGKIEHWNGATFAYSSALSISNNDIIYFHCIRRGNVYRSRFWKGNVSWNLKSDGVEVSDYRNLGASFTSNTTLGYAYIETQSTTNITLKSFKVTDRTKANVDYMFYGDSISVGQAAMYRGLRFEQKAINDPRKICVRAGGQERATVQLTYAVAEVVRINPLKLFIMMTTNDNYYGVANATIVAAIRTFVNAVEAALPTCEVHVIKAPPSDDTNGANTSVLNAALVTEFGAQCDVDFYTPLENPGAQPPYRDVTLYGDTVHPNAAGHLELSVKLINSGTL